MVAGARGHGDRRPARSRPGDPLRGRDPRLFVLLPAALCDASGKRHPARRGRPRFESAVTRHRVAACGRGGDPQRRRRVLHRRSERRAGRRADRRHRRRAGGLFARCAARYADRDHRLRHRCLPGPGQGRPRQRRRGRSGPGGRSQRIAHGPPGRPGGRTAAIGARRAGLHRPAALQSRAWLRQLRGRGGGHPDRAAGDADGDRFARRHLARRARRHAVRRAARSGRARWSAPSPASHCSCSWRCSTSSASCSGSRTFRAAATLPGRSHLPRSRR